jgi:quercetin dioxygenase-like cupin family protein
VRDQEANTYGFPLKEVAMAIPHAQTGDVIDVRPLGTALAQAKTTTLVKTAKLEVIRLVIPAGKQIPTHTVQEEITVHCLEGQVVFMADGAAHDLEAGRMLYLASGTPHSLLGVVDASLLLTIMIHQ